MSTKPICQEQDDKPTQLEQWKDITSEEMRAYFGLCIIMGINSLLRIAMYWSSDSFIGNMGIQNVMTKNRFEAISQFLHFSDSTTAGRCKLRSPVQSSSNFVVG